MVEQSDESKKSANRQYKAYLEIVKVIKFSTKASTTPQFATVKKIVDKCLQDDQTLSQDEKNGVDRIFKLMHLKTVADKKDSKTGKVKSYKQKLYMPEGTDEERRDVRDYLKIELPIESDNFGDKSQAETRITEETNATMGFLNDPRQNLVDKLANDPTFSAKFKTEAQHMKNKTLKADEETASKIYMFLSEEPTLKEYKDKIDSLVYEPKIKIGSQQKQSAVQKQKPTLYDRNPTLKAYATQKVPNLEREYYDVQTNKIYYPLSQNVSEQEKFMKEALYKIRQMEPEKRKEYKNVISKYEILAHMNKIIDLSKPSEVQIGGIQADDEDKQQQMKHLESLYRQYIPKNGGEEQKLKLEMQQKQNYLDKLKHDLTLYQNAGNQREINRAQTLIQRTNKIIDDDRKKLHEMVLKQMQDKAKELIKYRVKLQQDIEEEEAKQGQRFNDVQHQLVQAEGRQQHDLAVDILAQNNQQFNLANLDQFPIAVKQQEKTIQEKNYEKMFPTLEAILREEQDIQHLTQEQKKQTLDVLDRMEKDPEFFLKQFDFLKKQFDHQPYTSQENFRLEQEQQFLKRQAGNIQYFPLNEKTQQYIFTMGGLPWKTNKQYAQEQKEFLARNQITGELFNDDDKIAKKSKESEKETSIDSKELVKMIQNLAKYVGKIGGTINPEELDLEKYLNKTTIFTPEIKKQEPTQFSFSNSSFRLRTCE